ncbi:MAG: GPW/gp25 family protein [Bacteroidales bacterium]|nr:GPW/gp25 family protein [Bacteroidales bacterium]
MPYLKLPLEIGETGLESGKNLKKSVDDFVKVLITSACGSCKADPAFGFVLNNFAFENFNEHTGMIADSVSADNKKVSGSSRSIDTFASDLCATISKYEKRILSPAVNMTYITREKTIYIDVKGTLAPTSEPYSFKTTIRVWK